MKRAATVLAALIVVALVVSCDMSFRIFGVCRGDSTPATQDTSLVACRTLDSLALHPRDSLSRTVAP